VADDYRILSFRSVSSELSATSVKCFSAGPENYQTILSHLLDVMLARN